MTGARSAAVREADAVALARALAVRPVLRGVARAAETIDFKGRMLLHAGPPIPDPAAMAAPVRHSAIMAILYEGWARSGEEAGLLLDSGAVALEPAQDHGAAIPLADVLSESMPVLVVEDAANRGLRAYSTVNGGNGPVMRVGLCSEEVLERLRWVGAVLAPRLARVLEDAEIDMIDVADRALREGDDCHGRTVAGSRLLCERLLEAGGAAAFPAEVRAFLDDAAAFFLNPWMASVKAMMRAAEGVAGSSFVTAIGGNGVRFGLRISSRPGRWFTVEASPPLIPGRADLYGESAGAVGDSAIVDAFGCGAMAAAAYAPQTWERIRQTCAEHRLAFPVDLLSAPHPAFGRATALRTGLTVQRALALSQTPVISLGVLDGSGARGRFDGGFYFSPAEAFERAWAELEAHDAAA